MERLPGEAFSSSHTMEQTENKGKHENFPALLHLLSLCLEMSFQKEEAKEGGALRTPKWERGRNMRESHSPVQNGSRTLGNLLAI